MSNEGITAIILAAGASTRMRSRRSKLLHPLMGKTLAERALLKAKQISSDVIFVVGKYSEALQETLASAGVSFVFQDPPLGTGDAVLKAIQKIQERQKLPRHVFIMGGDSVLIRDESLTMLSKEHREKSAVLSLLSCDWPGSSHYGRILRSKAGNPERIVEFKNSNAKERELSEINAGFYLCEFESLRDAVGKIEKNPQTGEFYLTDLVEYFSKASRLVLAHKLSDFRECLGVNNPAELSMAHEVLRERIVERWMDEAVFIQSPRDTWIGEEVQIETDVRIGPGCIVEGRTLLKTGVELEAYCVVRDSVISEDSRIKSFSVVENSQLGKRVQVGPYARLRPGTQLGDEVRIGNFVETKNSKFAEKSKANHLSYVGDAEIGPAANIGAGTITCNYDGFDKHQTKIKEGAFIGSNTALVAPVEVGEFAIVGAGSVITKDVEAGAIAVERSEQRSLSQAATRFRESRKKKKGL